MNKGNVDVNEIPVNNLSVIYMKCDSLFATVSSRPALQTFFFKIFVGRKYIAQLILYNTSIWLFDVLPYVYGKQLRSCRIGRFISI